MGEGDDTVSARIRPMAHPLSPRLWSRVLTLLSLSLWLVACPSRPTTELAYEDFLTGKDLTSSRGERTLDLAMCAFENRFSQRLYPEEQLTATVELGEGASLILAGCSSHPDPELPRGADEDVLELELATADGKIQRHPISLPRTPSAWNQEVRLELPPGLTALRLKVKLPSGRRSFLRDFALRHRRPRSPEPLRRREGPPRQVLLISVDTLRDDALSKLDGSWPTPALDQFIGQSQVFRPHYAASSWTKPSHASLLSGLSSEVHGGTDYGRPLPPNLPWLPERLQRSGFATAGLVSDCLWLNPPFGFARGFDEYHSVPWNLAQSARQAFGWMSAHREQDFFFFFHTFEAHSDFRTLPYEGPGVTRRVVEERFGVPGYGCREEQCASGILSEIDAGRMKPLPNEEAILRFLYGEGVRHIDTALGRLFADLEAQGLFENLLIVLTSDHGEAFFEHGRLLHGSQWNVVLRVPMVVKWPGGTAAGQEVKVATSALDVAPTLLGFAGLPVDGLGGEELPGRDLRDLKASAPVFSWDPGVTVVAGSWKASVGLKGGERQLFDLATDPGETTNLANSEPEVMARLERLISQRQAADRVMASRLEVAPTSAASPTLTTSDIERLKALGYLGGPGGGETP